MGHLFWLTRCTTKHLFLGEFLFSIVLWDHPWVELMNHSNLQSRKFGPLPFAREGIWLAMGRTLNLSRALQGVWTWIESGWDTVLRFLQLQLRKPWHKATNVAPHNPFGSVPAFWCHQTTPPNYPMHLGGVLTSLYPRSTLQHKQRPPKYILPLWWAEIWRNSVGRWGWGGECFRNGFISENLNF